MVLVTAGEIEKLSPLITEAAHNVSANPYDVVAIERLHTIGREWASKVHVLSGAVDELVMPWSAAASKLALVATSGDAEELKKQVKPVLAYLQPIMSLFKKSWLCVCTSKWLLVIPSCRFHVE